jgi:hypothetical protein
MLLFSKRTKLIVELKNNAGVEIHDRRIGSWVIAVGSFSQSGMLKIKNFVFLITVRYLISILILRVKLRIMA